MRSGGVGSTRSATNSAVTVLAVVRAGDVIGGLERVVGSVIDESSRSGASRVRVEAVALGNCAANSRVFVDIVQPRGGSAANTVFAFARLLGAVDIVHFHSPTLTMWPMSAVLLARMRRKPIFVTFHLPSEPSRALRFRGRIRQASEIRLRALLLRFVRANLLAPSTSAARTSASRYGCGCVVHPSLNGVERREQSLGHEGAPLTRPENSLRVALIGRLNAHKMPEVILDAVELANGAGTKVQLDIIGTGELSSAAAERARGMRSLDIDVVEHGHLSDVQELLSRADLLALASKTEGCPTVVMEAAAHSVPSLVREGLDGISDILPPSAYFTVPRDAGASEFATAFNELALERQRLKVAGARAAIAYSDSFNQKYTVQRLHSRYMAEFLSRQSKKLTILEHVDHRKWALQSLAGLNAGGDSPYGHEKLELLNNVCRRYPDNRIRSVRALAPLSKLLGRVERQLQWRGLSHALSSVAPYRRGVVIGFFEDRVLGLLSLFRLFGKPRGVTVVVVVCWLAETANNLSHEAERNIGLALEQADKLVVFSANQRSIIAEHFPAVADRIYDIDLGIDVNFFKRPIGVELSNNRAFVLAVGVDINRDYATLIDAASELEYKFVIVCDRRRNLNGQESLPPNVKVLESIDHLSYRKLLWESSVVVTPTKAPAYPCGQTVLLEAMAAGVPNIITDSEAIRQYVTDGVTGLLVPEGNSIELAKSIRQLMTDESLRRSISERAQETVERAYSHQAMWSRIYEDVLADDGLTDDVRPIY